MFNTVILYHYINDYTGISLIYEMPGFINLFVNAFDVAKLKDL